MLRLFRRIAYSPGVRQVGIPTAVAIALLKAFQEQGLTWSVVLSRSFWTKLGWGLLITGVLGGLFFEWFVAKLGYPMSPVGTDNDRDRPA